MQFAIQYNLMNDTQLQHVADAVRSYPHTFVGVIPFSREITSEKPLEGKDYIPYGSTLLTNLALGLGWTGLHFDLDVLTYSNAIANRKDMLNDRDIYGHGGIYTADEAISFLENGLRGGGMTWFTRPDQDLKHYAGYVGSSNEICEHIRSMVDSYNRGEQGTYGMNPSTKLVFSVPQTIHAEWRWFIVDGKIIDGSMYRAHGQLRKLHETDADVIREAQVLADIWLPMDCVVMDTALVGDNLDRAEMKVVEFNTINSSGFYDNDVPAVFNALWKYHNKG